jgi:hypothetical protein
VSNYPPGVTGNEPQIVGYPEVNLSEQTCGAEFTHPITDDNGKVWHVTLDCPWEGDVEEAQVWGGQATWECPLCHSERETDVSHLGEPDPDEERDRYLDR